MTQQTSPSLLHEDIPSRPNHLWSSRLDYKHTLPNSAYVDYESVLVEVRSEHGMVDGKEAYPAQSFLHPRIAKEGEVQVIQVHSSNNSEDLFIK
ncbi:hypothetical protein Bca4012_043672 [Brassica carinata]